MIDMVAKAGLRGRFSLLCAKVTVILALALFGALLADRPALADAQVSAAAQRANAGLSTCSSNSGQALYHCVSGVLYRMCRDLTGAQVPQVGGALDTAASRLRSAVSKVEALSAISQAAAAISGALSKARSLGGALQGWGDASGLAAIAGVLGRAAKLIQAKG